MGVFVIINLLGSLRTFTTKDIRFDYSHGKYICLQKMKNKFIAVYVCDFQKLKNVIVDNRKKQECSSKIEVVFFKK